MASDGKASARSAGDWVRSLGWEDALEKEMATHFSILAWKIPWTEEPGGLHTVHGVAKESDMTACTHACMVTREKLGFVIRMFIGDFKFLTK